MKNKKIFSALLSIMIGASVVFSTAQSEGATRAELAKISVNQDGSNFKYWNKSSKSFKMLTEYVKDVTNPKSKNFIPIENRIAVFDLDGTLICETTPSYFEWMMHLERALNDPTYKASEKDLNYAKMVKGGIYHIGIPNPIQGTGLENSPEGKNVEKPESLPKDLDRGQAMSQEAVFSGMTLPEYRDYVKKFMQTPAEGLTNLKRGDAFYLPMVEVVSYLNANKFKVFIVSGTDREALRVLTDGILPIEKDNIIGTDALFIASHQGNKDGLDYVYQKDDEVIRGDFVLKNVKMNKVSNIVREIGRQPVLAFGNSSGDSSMLNYTIANNKYKSLSFALLCDDTKRELGSPKKAQSMQKLCDQYGWVPVSMKDDFKTIYGNNVKRADK